MVVSRIPSAIWHHCMTPSHLHRRHQWFQQGFYRQCHFLFSSCAVSFFLSFFFVGAGCCSRTGVKHLLSRLKWTKPFFIAFRFNAVDHIWTFFNDDVRPLPMVEIISDFYLLTLGTWSHTLSPTIDVRCTALCYQRTPILTRGVVHLEVLAPSSRLECVLPFLTLNNEV